MPRTADPEALIDPERLRDGCEPKEEGAGGHHEQSNGQR